MPPSSARRPSAFSRPRENSTSGLYTEPLALSLSECQPGLDFGLFRHIITASAGTPPLIVCGADLDSFSPAPDGSIVAGASFTVSYKIFNVGDTPVNVIIDRGDAGDANDLGGFYINCSGA